MGGRRDGGRCRGQDETETDDPLWRPLLKQPRKKYSPQLFPVFFPQLPLSPFLHIASSMFTTIPSRPFISPLLHIHHTLHSTALQVQVYHLSPFYFSLNFLSLSPFLSIASSIFTIIPFRPFLSHLLYIHHKFHSTVYKSTISALSCLSLNSLSFPFHRFLHVHHYSPSPL